MLKTKVLKSLLSASLVAAFAVPIAVQAQTPAAGMNTPAASALNKADQKIVMDMARANMAEIEAGKIAVNKAQSPEVKAYAQRMIDDHTRALSDVTNLAQTKGVTLPTELDAKHKAMAAKLNKMQGEAFDREYMKHAGVSDHTKVHAMLKKDAARAKDPDVKALAAKMMPTVEEHLTAAKGMPMAKKSGGMADAQGIKSPATGEGGDMSQGTSGTSGTTGTSAGAVRPAPTDKDTKPQPAPAVKY